MIPPRQGKMTGNTEVQKQLASYEISLTANCFKASQSPDSNAFIKTSEEFRNIALCDDVIMVMSTPHISPRQGSSSPQIPLLMLLPNAPLQCYHLVIGKAWRFGYPPKKSKN
eukprot:TRINITY_DN5895_c0_g2_i3.p4 TRINITY_DN5895_c0_g2~~TRINITY_DN5895_c0_g2_i3.p4  ORF type:complete len:112 (+),score=10.07 TRINITY_DN5895_c0_g2_i3:478-813(+)